MKYLVLAMLVWLLASCSEDNKALKLIPFNELTAAEKYIIENDGTEAPHSGEYNKHAKKGVYTCKRCNTALFHSSSKFDSKTGWPSFDESLKGAVGTQSDFGREEIICRTCTGHLGHVFRGEGMTAKDTRHCVNSLSLNFVSQEKVKMAIFASGCFWGTDYWLRQLPGVLATSTGYIGGSEASPTYEDVCTGTTGHYEAVRVIYDGDKLDFETLAKQYFDTHNPEQANGQGNDIGSQYLPAIFYLNIEQKKVSESLLDQLRKKGLRPATELKQASRFWPAEQYHQDYYLKNGKKPYCHFYKPLFGEEEKKKEKGRKGEREKGRKGERETGRM